MNLLDLLPLLLYRERRVCAYSLSFLSRLLRNRTTLLNRRFETPATSQHGSQKGAKRMVQLKFVSALLSAVGA